ncbi:MAG: cell division protein ZapA [Candidatus Cloacimonetes bacterium]|nr:cell division protein ZapA [Candidatus Cloacimonadota bacterium]
MQTVEVEIFGRKFRLRTDDTAKTNAVVAAINAQLQDLQDLYEDLDFTKLLLLMALKQQEKINDLNHKNELLDTDIKKMNAMIGQIIGDA